MDRHTRGKTSPNRLRRLDVYVCRYEPMLFRRQGGRWRGAVAVDVGLGRQPWTTLEMARTFRAHLPTLRVVGVELDPERADVAQRMAGDAIDVRCGGVPWAISDNETARLVRAMNLLRQYPVGDVLRMHEALTAPLLPGGLALVGSSGPLGRVMVSHLLRRTETGMKREGLLFSTNFRSGFAPMLFWDRLPRDLRRGVSRAHPIHDFFAAWTHAWRRGRQCIARDDLASLFVYTARALATSFEGVSLDAWMLRRGYLRWCPPGGVALPS